MENNFLEKDKVIKACEKMVQKLILENPGFNSSLLYDKVRSYVKISDKNHKNHYYDTFEKFIENWLQNASPIQLSWRKIYFLEQNIKSGYPQFYDTYGDPDYYLASQYDYYIDRKRFQKELYQNKKLIVTTEPQNEIDTQIKALVEEAILTQETNTKLKDLIISNRLNSIEGQFWRLYSAGGRIVVQNEPKFANYFKLIDVTPVTFKLPSWLPDDLKEQIKQKWEKEHKQQLAIELVKGCGGCCLVWAFICLLFK